MQNFNEHGALADYQRFLATSYGLNMNQVCKITKDLLTAELETKVQDYMEMTSCSECGGYVASDGVEQGTDHATCEACLIGGEF